MQAAIAVPKVPTASHVLRRSLISTRGAVSSPRTPGKRLIALTLAMRFTGTRFCKQEGQRSEVEAVNHSEGQNEQAEDPGRRPSALNRHVQQSLAKSLWQQCWKGEDTDLNSNGLRQNCSSKLFLAVCRQIFPNPIR